MPSFKLQRGSEKQFLTDEQKGVILDIGEIVFVVDTNEIVIGDGFTPFSSLKRFLNQSQVATTLANGFMSSSDKSTLDTNTTNLNNHIGDTTKHDVWQSGNLASRPTDPIVGQRYFDTTLGKPIWYNGTNWVDATGTIV